MSGMAIKFTSLAQIETVLQIVPMYRLFFRDLPESDCLLDVDEMIEEAAAFDYSTMTPDVIASSWVPSYCRRESRASVPAS